MSSFWIVDDVWYNAVFLELTDGEDLLTNQQSAE